MSIFDKAVMIPKTLEDYLAARDSAVAKYQQLQKLHDMMERELNSIGNYLMPNVLDRYMDLARFTRELDQRFWRKAFDATGFMKLMDREARAEFDRSLDKEPPAFTLENVRGIFLSKAQEAEMMFARGLVNVFKQLSKDYRTNSKEPFRVGPKAILEYMTTPNWSKGLRVNYGREDIVGDIDRVIKVLDDQEYFPRQLESAINDAWGKGEIYEDDYYRIKGFKKGTMHIEFKRLDLLNKANDIIAQWYGDNKLAA